MNKQLTEQTKQHPVNQQLTIQLPLTRRREQAAAAAAKPRQSCPTLERADGDKCSLSLPACRGTSTHLTPGENSGAEADHSKHDTGGLAECRI